VLSKEDAEKIYGDEAENLLELRTVERYECALLL
jgi:hypothetical protein